MSKMADGEAAGGATPGRRICVIGTSGAGKTHVARELARRLGLPYISNDALIWRPNWQETPAAERLAGFDAATAGAAWTIDGNIGSREEDRLVLDRCDTLVWLDLPRWQVWGQVLVRTLWRMLTREVLWHGNRESVRTLFSRDSIVWWSIKTYARRRRRYAAMFAEPARAGLVRARLRSRGEVNRWLASLTPTLETMRDKSKRDVADSQ